MQRNPAAAFANEQRNYDYTRGGFTVRTPIGDGQALEAKLGDLAGRLTRRAYRAKPVKRTSCG